MKKLLILSAVAIMSLGTAAMAQDNTSTMTKQDHSKMEKPMKDCVMMKDGKMWVMKGGKSMEMTKTMTMNNGTMVMADGTVKMKNGKTMTMKDGESMSMSGKMMKHKMDGGM